MTENTMPCEMIENKNFSQAEHIPVLMDQIIKNSCFEAKEYRDIKANRSIFLNCHFKDCQLTKNHYPYAFFRQCTFENVDLVGCDFEHAQFTDC